MSFVANLIEIGSSGGEDFQRFLSNITHVNIVLPILAPPNPS
jgi:hypothetical protein